MFKTLKIFSMIALALLVATPMTLAQQRRGNASEQQEPQKLRGIIVRAAYWQGAKAQNKEALFYKDGREYLPFRVTEMAFLKAYGYRGPLPMQLFRKATPEEIEARKANGVAKNDLEYVEYAKIPLREDMKEVGVLIPGDIRSSNPAVFDFSEKAFPQGSLLFVNMSAQPIRGNIDLADRTNPDGGKYEVQNFELQPRNLARSRKVDARAILEVKLATPAENKVWKLAFASQLILTPEMRSVVFLLPEKDKKGRERISIVSASVAPLPKNLLEPTVVENADKNGVPANDRANKKTNRKNKDVPEQPTTTKHKKRRV